MIRFTTFSFASKDEDGNDEQIKMKISPSIDIEDGMLVLAETYVGKTKIELTDALRQEIDNIIEDNENIEQDIIDLKKRLLS